MAISGATLDRGIVGCRLPGDHNRIKQLYLFFHPFKNVLKCKKANARPRRGQGLRDRVGNTGISPEKAAQEEAKGWRRKVDESARKSEAA